MQKLPSLEAQEGQEEGEEKMIRRTYNKYRVAPKHERTWNGTLYASKTESVRAMELQMMLKGGALLSVDEQPQFKLTLAGIVYVADFRVRDDDGREWIEDVKGVVTARFKVITQLWPYYGTLPLVILKVQGTLGQHTWKRETIVPKIERFELEDAHAT